MAHAQLAQPVVDGLELRAVEAGEVRVDAAFASQRQQAPGLPQTQWAGQLQLALGEVEMPTIQWFQAIAELRLLARLQGDALRQEIESHAFRHMVEDLDFLRLGEIVMGDQLHLAPAP